MRRLFAPVVGAAIASAVLLAMPSSSLAHGMRSGALRIEETDLGHALVLWRQSVPGGIELDFPSECTSARIGGAEKDVGDHLYLIDCDRELRGRTFGVRGLGTTVSDATVLVTFTDGRTASHLLSPDAPTWTLPADADPISVTTDYVGAGLIHILSGPDHLFFLFMLALLLRRVRIVLLAESAFTISHSISFSATALDLVQVPPEAAEACIALSLLLLVLDVDRARARGLSISLRGAALTAFVFGLVHGLGFAGGLRELGLPDHHVSFALVGFGAGVEIGQVMFLVVVLVIVHLVARSRFEARFLWASSSLGGVLASYWLISRVFVCLCP